MLGLLTAAEADLEKGVGVFEFARPDSGQRMRVFYVKDPSYEAHLPPVLVLHGMRRNADEYRDAWIDLAAEHGLFVIVPEFTEESYPGTVGYNLGNIFPSEEDLTYTPTSQWSYLVPDQLFDYLKDTLRATRAQGYFAFGHSAGSQFLHRKVAFSPDPRLLLAVSANAGWYTFPSIEASWPYGFKGTGMEQADLVPFLASNLFILLGEEDNDPQHRSLRRAPEAMEQGLHRFERGHQFFAAGAALAEELDVPFAWQLDTVPGVAHSNSQMAPAAARIMAGAMAQMNPPDSLFWIKQGLAVLIIGVTAFFIIRRYQTHATLFLAGFALLTLTYIFGIVMGTGTNGLEDSPTGWFGFDLFAVVKESFSSRTATIGMIIMAAGGFARYMSHIHASKVLVSYAIKPLGFIKNPYLLLAFSYILGQILNIFIPSATGLAMLLLVALFPTLVHLGVRPVAAAAVIGTTSCLDLGPASPGSNVAATVSGMEPVVYFVKYQMPLATVMILVIAALHYVWQRFCDARSEPTEAERELIQTEMEQEGHGMPAVYAFLPLLPLGLLLVFSPLVITAIQVDVVTAMLISLFVSMGFEAIRLRSLKNALEGIVQFFKGMGDIFATVVTLVIAAETFAVGIMSTGLIDSLIDMVENTGFGPIAMVVALVVLIGFTAILTGSGSAPLFSFAKLVPGIAGPLEVAAVSLILPLQLAAGVFRSMSPVAGVIIAVSSAVKVSPFDIVKRTSIPMLGGILAMLIWQGLFG